MKMQIMDALNHYSARALYCKRKAFMQSLRVEEEADMTYCHFFSASS